MRILDLFRKKENSSNFTKIKGKQFLKIKLLSKDLLNILFIIILFILNDISDFSFILFLSLIKSILSNFI